LLDYPDIGLAVVVHALVLNTFRHLGNTCLRISARSQSFTSVQGSPALQRIEEAREAWGEQIPVEPVKLWEWCLEQPREILIELVTFCAAMTIDTVVLKRDGATVSMLAHADKLAKAVKLDMTHYFAPTADNYFSKVGKAEIIHALEEAGATLPGASMKKADMAKYAERCLAGKGWIPKLLR
jgi:ParB family chromosome partitioning protein